MEPTNQEILQLLKRTRGQLTFVGEKGGSEKLISWMFGGGGHRYAEVI
jgi:hypothetical protein